MTQGVLTYACKPGVEAMEMDGEWVLLNPETCTITKLNELGGLIWSMLQREEELPAIGRAIMAEYDIEEAVAREDLSRFLDSLQAVGLIEMNKAGD
jgi:hypothetical protein